MEDVSPPSVSQSCVGVCADCDVSKDVLQECTEIPWFLGRGHPSWSPQTTWRTWRTRCHDSAELSTSRGQERREIEKKIFQRYLPAVLVFLNVLHSILLIPQPLRWIVPEGWTKWETHKKLQNYLWQNTFLNVYISNRWRVRTCTAAWPGWWRSWRSFWGTRSCRCPARWCCKSSWDQNLKKEGWTQGTMFTAENLKRRIKNWDLAGRLVNANFFAWLSLELEGLNTTQDVKQTNAFIKNLNVPHLNCMVNSMCSIPC